MPDRFRINHPISNEMLTFIQGHQRVVSATRSLAGTNDETTLVILDGNYTREQIENAVTRLIKDKQMEIFMRNRPAIKEEFEML